MPSFPERQGLGATCLGRESLPAAQGGQRPSARSSSVLSIDGFRGHGWKITNFYGIFLWDKWDIYIYYGYMDMFIGYHYEINGFILLKKGLGGCFETTLQQKVNFVQAFPIFELALKFLTLVRNMAAKCCFFCATWF